MCAMNRLEPVEPVTLQQRVHGASRPPAWHLDKLHRVLRVRRGIKNDGMKEDNLLSLSYGRIIPKDINTSEGLLPENFEGYQIVEPGNIVMRLTDLQNDKRSLRQGLVKERGIITSAYDALDVPKGQCPEFWFYSLLALDLAKHYYSLGGGVRQSVKFTDFPNDWIYRPDLTTQRQIADFLDRETARIDGLIEKRRRMIDSIRSRILDFSDLAVLGQIGSHEVTKDSGIPWMGRIPAQWELIRAKYLFREMSRSPEPDDGVITAFRDGQVCLRSRRREEGYTFAELEVGYQRIQTGDLVINTMDAFAGAIGVSEDDGKATGEYAVCTPSSDRINCHYFARVLRCMARRDYIYVLCPSVRERAPRFRFVRFATVALPVPSRSEQDRIVARIDDESGDLQRLMEVNHQSVERLREYRSALITAAVTGQIDPTTRARAGNADRQLDAMEAEEAT